MGTRLFISGEIINFLFSNANTELQEENLIRKFEEEGCEIWLSNFILLKSNIENTPAWAKKIISSATILNLKPDNLIKYLENNEIKYIQDDEIRICKNLNQVSILTLGKDSWGNSGLKTIKLSEMKEFEKIGSIPLVDLIGQYSSISSGVFPASFNACLQDLKVF